MMIRRPLLSFAIALAFVAPSLASQAPATQPVVLPRAAQFDLTGPGGRAYRVWVAEPSGAPTPPSAGGYATLVLLDANAMFATAVEAVRFQKGQVPTLVIGVGYPDDKTVDIQRRYRDFTPVTPAEHIWSSGSPGEARAVPEATGGEDEFLDFLEKTIRPTIATMYPLDDSRRAIFGHSLAGRLVLHAMFTRPASYTHYVAASPSIWWDARSIVKEAEAFRAKTDRPAVSLLMTAAEFEQTPTPGTSPERQKFFAMARMVDSARELAESLNAGGVPATFVAFPNENHGSVVPAAISRSLRFALTATTRPTR